MELRTSGKRLKHASWTSANPKKTSGISCVDEKSPLVPMGIQEECKPIFDTFILRRSFVLSRGFEMGMALATKIIRSAIFIELLVELGLISGDQVPEVVAVLTSEVFILDFIRMKKDLNAYACVYRDLSPSRIFFNPMLLVNCSRNEADSDVSMFKSGLFFTVKLIHEVTHLINGRFNDALRTTTTKITPSKIIQEFSYIDAGDMMEKLMFGGLLEHAEQERGLFLCLGDLVVYDNPNPNLDGHVAVIDSAIFSREPTRDNLKYTLGAVHKKRTRSALVLPASRACEMSFDLSEEEEDDDCDLPIARY